MQEEGVVLSLCCGDEIEYYSPVSVAGSKHAHRVATIISIEPGKEFPLTLSNLELLPAWCTNVKQVKTMSTNGDVLDHKRKYCCIDKYKLVAGEIATVGDAISMHSAQFKQILRTNIDKMKDDIKDNKFAQMDFMQTKFGN